MRKIALTALTLTALASPALAGAPDSRLGTGLGSEEWCEVGKPKVCRDFADGTMVEFVRFDSRETGNRQGVVFRFQGKNYVTTFDRIDLNGREPF